MNILRQSHSAEVYVYKRMTMLHGLIQMRYCYYFGKVYNADANWICVVMYRIFPNLSEVLHP